VPKAFLVDDLVACPVPQLGGNSEAYGDNVQSEAADRDGAHQRLICRQTSAPSQQKDSPPTSERTSWMRGNVRRRSILDTPSSGPVNAPHHPAEPPRRHAGRRGGDQETLARKRTELCDRLAAITLHPEAVDRSRSELADLAVKVFELSRALSAKWLTADYAMKR